MSKGAKLLIGALGALLALGLASPAAASAGYGIRLGGSDGRLHPFLELESRSDSNVLYWAPGESVSDVIVHVRPGLTLTVPGESTAVDLHAMLDWAQYLGVEGKTTDLSRLYGEASLGVGVNRNGQLGLELNDAFYRSDNTAVLSLGSAVIANDNDLRLALPWRPGGGALTLTVGGEWQLETYEPYLKGVLCISGLTQCDSSTLSKLGWNEVRGTGEVRWKFLPRTAYVLDGGYFSRLPNDRAYSVQVSGYRVSTGFAGLITTRLAGTIKGGYGQSVGDVAFRTWLANAEFEWLASDTASARLGYVHDFGTDTGTLFAMFQSHRAYADGHILLGGRITGRLGASLERREYEGVDARATLFHVEPAIEAEITRAVRAVLGYAYTDRASRIPPGTPGLPGFEFSKHEVWLRGVLTY